jgi:ubiquinone/menaquinone biosynthesis C-methylase UbiE
MSDDGFDWRRYLAEFHRERAGVVEAVLSRSLAGDHSPYRWLARAVSADARIVLDLACGSGAMSRELASSTRMVVGLDLSEHELAVASGRGPGPWVRGDGLALPFADESVDAVTSSIGLAVITPMGRVIEETARVLRPGGVVAAIAPAARPLEPSDLALLTRLNTRLRTRPQFPGPLELAGFTKVLHAYGLHKVEDARERYCFPVRSREDAELLMHALYLPQTRRSRVEAAIEYLEDRLAKQPLAIAIPMRRVVAIK